MLVVVGTIFRLNSCGDRGVHEGEQAGWGHRNREEFLEPRFMLANRKICMWRRWSRSEKSTYFFIMHF
jgi:hypothetical protein